jgi:nucleoside-diphosphate-sugar epimerase
MSADPRPVLVTGATGFVGRHLRAELAERGRAARAVSRADGPGVLGLGEFTGRTDWRKALAGSTAVVHLMARVHRRGEPDDDAAYLHDNVEVTLNLARQARDSGVRLFVFLSSIKVHGERTTPGRSFRETDTPAPQDAYGRSKLMAEDGLRALAGSGFEVVIIRPPLVYGPGVGANFRSLMRLAQSGLPLPFGAIRNRRSLVFVRNLTRLIVATLDHPAAANQTFLVADGAAVSTTELLRELARAGGRPSRLFPVPAPLLQAGLRMLGRGGIADRLLGDLEVDDGHTRRSLGWAPPYSFAEGIAATVGVPSVLDFRGRSA